MWRLKIIPDLFALQRACEVERLTPSGRFWSISHVSLAVGRFSLFSREDSSLDEAALISWLVDSLIFNQAGHYVVGGTSGQTEEEAVSDLEFSIEVGFVSIAAEGVEDEAKPELG